MFRLRSESGKKFRPEARREKARPEEGKKGTLCLERKTRRKEEEEKGFVWRQGGK